MAKSYKCYRCDGEFSFSQMYASSKQDVCKVCAKILRDERRKELRKQQKSIIEDRNKSIAFERDENKKVLADGLHYKVTTMQPLKAKKLVQAQNAAEDRRLEKERLESLGL